MDRFYRILNVCTCRMTTEPLINSCCYVRQLVLCKTVCVYVQFMQLANLRAEITHAILYKGFG